jgi:hypothetical protein
MCIFFYLNSPMKIEKGIISKYQKDYDVFIQDISSLIKRRTEGNYYFIHRQCACDIINSNINELKNLFNIVYKKGNFKFVITDLDGKLEDIIKNFQNVKININDFIEKYPNQLSLNELYEVI